VRMPFGKYRGTPVDEVPESYLLWVLDNCERIGPTLRRAIEDVLGVSPSDGADFGAGASAPNGSARSAVLDAVQRCRRTLAKSLHPDRGGDTALMQAANGAVDALVKEVERAFGP
jgi:hypothetical protein